MNNIEKVFKYRKAYIAYITAGQKPNNEMVDYVKTLVNGGVNLLEVGVPFSDPVADGPVIQKAMNNAVNNNTSMSDVFELIVDIKKNCDIPIVLFTYYNPILQQSNDFYSIAKSTGIDGILVVDLPLEEADEYIDECSKYDINPIFVVTPSTSSDRIQLIDSIGKGFIYYACRKGTTGVKSDLPNDFESNISRIKDNSSLPVVAGFGISSRTVSKQVCDVADGFVVGSLFVDAIEQSISKSELSILVKSLV